MAILERDDKNSVAYILLNSPETLNSLSDEMLAALTYEFEKLKNDPQIRAVVLSGAGKAFCAGHNLKEMTKGRKAEDGGKSYFLDLFKRCAKTLVGTCAKRCENKSDKTQRKRAKGMTDIFCENSKTPLFLTPLPFFSW